MKILLVSSYLPYPLLNGGNIRLYNLLKHLSQEHDITLIAEVREQQTKEDIKEVEKVCQRVITVPRRKQWTLGNITRSGFSLHSFLSTGHKLADMQEIITRELQDSAYDLIHVETFYVLQNVPLTSLPIVLVEHNIEYLVYKRYMQKAPVVVRPLLALDILKLQREEEDAWKRAKIVATVSEEEKKVIGRKNVTVVPNGVDTNQFRLKSIDKVFEGESRKILYIGDFKWVQNKDAASYILRDLWPRIKSILSERQEMLDVSLWIVGRNMPESLKELGKNDHKILFDDNNTQSTPEIFSDASLLLAPKRVGGGTSYKNLEAMAVGTPVVTNSLGLEGFEIRKNQDIIVADTPQELASETVSLLTNKKRYEEVSRNGRKAVEDAYDWTAIAQKLLQTYKEAVK